jgi:hypothetical protein
VHRSTWLRMHPDPTLQPLIVSSCLQRTKKPQYSHKQTLSWKLPIQPSSSCSGASSARATASSLITVCAERSKCSPDSSCRPQKDPGFLGAHQHGAEQQQGRGSHVSAPITVTY